MSLLLNLLWILFGGLWMALGWLLAAILMGVTVIGLPWAFAALRIARYTLLPFGQTVVSRDELTNSPTVGTGVLGFAGNLIWLLLAGWWLALGHVITAVGWAITVIGLPFAWAHLKLAGLALWPVGREIISLEEAGHARRQNRVAPRAYPGR